jgi:hypothetical protein
MNTTPAAILVVGGNFFGHLVSNENFKNTLRNKVALSDYFPIFAL